MDDKSFARKYTTTTTYNKCSHLKTWQHLIRALLHLTALYLRLVMILNTYLLIFYFNLLYSIVNKGLAVKKYKTLIYNYFKSIFEENEIYGNKLHKDHIKTKQKVVNDSRKKTHLLKFK